MANPFVKFWKYLMASFSSKIDEHADPKVQIQQAIEEAQRQHQALSQQAAAVIGNQRQLEMKLNRQLGEVEKLQASDTAGAGARRRGAQQGRRGRRRTEFENAAQAFATQLVTAEQGIEDLKTLHDQSLQAAAQAKQAVERNAHDAAAEAGRAHQAAQPAGAGEDAGAGLRVAEPDERAGRAGQHAVAGGGPRQDREALHHRAGLGRAGAELGPGPDDGGPGLHHADGRAVAAGADPGVDGRRLRWRPGDQRVTGSAQAPRPTSRRRSSSGCSRRSKQAGPA